eukprot:Unigene1320_Nuclearia_a/m.4193 Unigene1320_Nuclearia_a/g.4193  ORF Unigene1320_Nuclearia_a/g.4193 Unigene1320_Nuclearia_a/m.4193 type:complete len:538 (-) Unigene1320_Nuclearia_a:114-1727(-)
MGNRASHPAAAAASPSTGARLQGARDTVANANLAKINPVMAQLQQKLDPTPVGSAGKATSAAKKRIGIIGGGVAGVVCAYQLTRDPQQRFDVQLYDANDYLGGAVASGVYKSPKGKDVVIDTAVVFTEENFYPNVFQFLNLPEFMIETEEVELGSTGAFTAPDGGEQFWSNVVKGGELRKKFKDEANRFMLQLAELQKEQDPRILFTMTAGEWLKKYNFSDEFVQKAVIPMLLTFAITRNSLLSVPLAILHIYFGGGALQFVTGSYGRRAVKGWSEYMKKFHAALTDKVVNLNSKVTKLTRCANGAGVDLVIDKAGTVVTEHFDEVVFAILKDQAATIMGDSILPAEKAIFSQIQYEDMVVYVHNDPNVLSPSLQDDQGYWRYQYFNYRYLGTDFGNYVRGATTYVPQHDPDNPTKEIQLPLLTYANADKFDGVVLPRDDLVLEKRTWRHVKQSVPMFGANLQLHAVQGKDRVWYAGNDVGINFHEGALDSGLVIAKALGVDYPFAQYFKALWVYQLFEKFMLEGVPPVELAFLQPH